MNYTVPKYIWIPIILLMTLVSVISFSNKMHKLIPESNLDWSNIIYTNKKINITVDTVSLDYMRIKNVDYNFNPNFTYELANGENQFYFNYTYYIQDSINYDGVFLGLRWLNKIPNIKESNNYTLNQLKLGVKKQDTGDWVCFGDGFLVDNEAKYVRELIFRDKKVNFLGPNMDVYNFNHMALSGYNASEIIQASKNIPFADTYIIGFKSIENIIDFGFNDFSNILLQNITNINTNAHIIWVELPCISSQNKTTCKLYNNFVGSLKNKGVYVVEADKLLQDSTYLLDKTELNKSAFERITKEIIDESIAR